MKYSKRIAEMLKREEKRLTHLKEYRFSETLFCEGFKILDEKGNLFCIADIKGRQVIIPDINGGSHHYPSPEHTTTGMTAPAFKKRDHIEEKKK